MEFTLKAYSEKSVINHIANISMAFSLLTLFTLKIFLEGIDIPYFIGALLLLIFIVSISLNIYKMTLDEKDLYKFSEGIHFNDESIVINKIEIQINEITKIEVEIKGYKNILLTKSTKHDGSGNHISISFNNKIKNTNILLTSANELENLNSYLKHLESRNIKIKYN